MKPRARRRVDHANFPGAIVDTQNLVGLLTKAHHHWLVRIGHRSRIRNGEGGFRKPSGRQASRCRAQRNVERQDENESGNRSLGFDPRSMRCRGTG